MRRLDRNYSQNFLLYESAMSLVLVTCAVLFTEFVWGRDQLRELLDGRRELWYSTVSSIAGSLLGFVITGLSVLFALTQSDQYTLLRRSPYYRQIYTIYLNTVLFLGMVTLIGLAGLFAERGQQALAWIPYLLGWTMVVSIFRVWRCTWVLWRIIQIGSN